MNRVGLSLPPLQFDKAVGGIEMAKKEVFDPRPGTLGKYLLDAGWVPVHNSMDFPLWEKDNRTMPANKAILEVYRDIWKRNREKGGPKDSP